MCLWTLGLLLALTNHAFSAEPPSHDPVAVIEANRKNAKPRPIAPSVSLNAEERARERVFKGAKKSVVHISSGMSNVVFRDAKTGRWFEPKPGTGTGFVWDEKGHVVTNYHVIAVDDPLGIPSMEADRLVVQLSNGKQYQAVVIGRSLAYDVAVLHVFAPLNDMKPLPMGRSKGLRMGQSVLALGNPFGLDHTLTSGIVSGLGRELITTYGTPIQDVIQTDAAINPGNSGGPLLDMGGRLSGMATSIASTSGSNAGVGFAIPADILNRVVPELIEKGQQGRPELGFILLPLVKAQEAGVREGLVVSDVVKGSFADLAGLRPWVLEPESARRKDIPIKVYEVGDVIVGFEGKPLLNDLHLFVLMEVHPKGKPFVFDVLREGRVVQVSVDPWTRPGIKTAV